MRLDKFEGMGESIWAGEWVVDAAVEGFFRALRLKERRGETGGMSVEVFLRQLRNVSADELSRALRSQLERYQAGDRSDYELIASHARNHTEALYRALRDRTSS